MLSVWLASSLFAFSVDNQILGGYLVWIILTLWSIYFCRAVYTFEDPGSWRSKTAGLRDDEMAAI
jgi:hypothetical protein